MVVTKKVQGAVDQQNGDFFFNRMFVLGGLYLRLGKRDDDLTQVDGFSFGEHKIRCSLGAFFPHGKRKHVGGRVFAHVLFVKLTYPVLSRDEDAHLRVILPFGEESLLSGAFQPVLVYRIFKSVVVKNIYFHKFNDNIPGSQRSAGGLRGMKTREHLLLSRWARQGR